jgi:Family of unknown function (DUF5343)
MANESTAKTPPYASFVSFTNFLNHLRDHPPLPPRLDKSVMRHLSYTTQQAIVAALRSLNLVADGDVPTERLEKLIHADDKERATLMLATIKEGYPYFWNGSFDLERATADQFAETIKKQGKVAGSTAEKAISFFIAAAAQAGVKLSPHLTKRKPSPTNGAAAPTARRNRPARPRTRPPRQPPPIAPQADREPKQKSPMVDRLLAKFPTFDPKWEEKIQAKWFEGFERLMSGAGLKEAKKP